MTTRRSWIGSAIAQPIMAILVYGSLIILAGVIAFAAYRFLFAAAAPNERALAQAVYAQDLAQVAALLASGAQPTVWVQTNVEIGGGNACKAALAAVDMGTEVSLAILAQVINHGCDPDESFAFPTGGGGDSGGSGPSYSALELAARCCLDAVETVLAAGATTGGRAGAGAITVAIEARRRDTVAMVRRLIQAGADVNARDRRGRTPLAVAVGERNREVVELLERRGATEW